MARGKHVVQKTRSGRVSWGILGLVFGLLLALSAPVTADHVANPTPSTNDANRNNGWAHFNVLDTRIGEVDIEFVSTRNFASCFEYRRDGEPSTVAGDNFNAGIHDGLWTFVCVNNSTHQQTITAAEYVEIRMVFGAETDERFDWTKVGVLAAPEPPQTEKDECKQGGHEARGFSNQGRCIASVVANERGRR